MTRFFHDYQLAYTYAVNLANATRQDVGIYITHDIQGKAGFTVDALPKKEKRYGRQLRCEIVSPGDLNPS